MSTDAVTPLRRRMIEDMNARKLSAGTQRGHIHSCKRFAAFLNRSPDTATTEDIRRFQLHLAEAGVSICNRNRIMTGVRLGDLLPSKHPRQLPRIMRAGQLMGEVGAAERDGEEEAQRRGLRIHRRRLRTLLDLCELEAADVVAARGIGGAADKSGKALDMPDIVVLCLVAKAPDRHVREHAAAKIADRLVAHRRLLS